MGVGVWAATREAAESPIARATAFVRRITQGQHITRNWPDRSRRAAGGFAYHGAVPVPEGGEISLRRPLAALQLARAFLPGG